MSKKGIFVYEVISQFLAGKFSRREASELLQVRERAVSRMARRIEKKGVLGAAHGNRGKSPTIKKSAFFKRKVLKLVKERYFDFNMLHCLEMLNTHHHIVVSRETFRRWCHEQGLVKRAKRRKAVARQRRERMPNPGLLLQMDGSPHKWNLRDIWHLISAIDDATSEVPYAEFFEAEDTLGAMKVLRGVIEKKGIPFAVYVDKAGCFGGGNRQKYNQFKRACEEIGIKVIPANSPEAKGRIERSFDTFQDRLIPELRIYGITKMGEANEYLRRKFLKNYWDRKLTVEPRNPESKYRAVPKGIDLNEIFCLKYQRTVNGDHTVSWDAKTYQLDWPKDRPIRGHKIEFRVYPDGNWKAFHAEDPVSLKPVFKPIKVRTTKQDEKRIERTMRRLKLLPITEYKGQSLRYATA